MSHRKLLESVGRAVGVGLLVLTTVRPAAQGVTGTVLGTVKDAQAAVVPGATVTLISESKRTESAPAITNASGDFVFPNVTADTYTVRVTMNGFASLERRNVAVSPGDRVAVGTLTIQISKRVAATSDGRKRR